MASSTATSLHSSASSIMSADDNTSIDEQTPLLCPPSCATANKDSNAKQTVGNYGSDGGDGREHQKQPAVVTQEVSAEEVSAEDEERAFQLHNRKRLHRVLPALAIGTFLAAADQTIVVSSYSKIGSELGALSKTSWLATGYLLTLSSFQILYGKLSDIYGRKNLFLFAYLAFGFGSLFCGLAQGMSQLIAARVIVGVGGGGFITLSVIIISDLVPLRRRGIWQAIRNLIYAVGLSAGSMGGMITDRLGWRWSFLIQIPIVLIGLLNVVLFFEDDKRLKWHWKESLKRVDYLGAILIIVAVSTLLLWLDRGSDEGWGSPSAIIYVCASTLAFGAFAFVEDRIAIEPFVPRRIFLSRTAIACFLCNFLIFGWWLSILFHLPLAWEVLESVSGTTTAVRLLPAIIAGVVASLIAGVAMQITGRYYLLTVVSHLGMIAGVLPIMLYSGWIMRSTVGVLVGSAVASFFLNVGATTTLVALQAYTAQEDQATAIAALSLFRSLGSEIGLAGSAALMQEVLRSQLWQSLAGNWPNAKDIIQEVTDSLENVRLFSPEIQARIRGSYEVAIGWSFLMCLCFAIVGFIISFFLRERSLGAKK